MSAPSTASSHASSRLPAWPVWGATVIVVGLLVRFPPFHVVSQKATAAGAATVAAGAFDPAAFAEQFWAAQLQPAAGRAAALTSLLTDLRRDAAKARQRHARRVGLGDAAYYFARGSGRVAVVERSRILVEIDGAVVAIRTGPVFGNAVRDGCGLLELNQAPGLTEFNVLSAELNRLVEARVQPALKAATVGATLTFAGCAEAPEALAVDGPLLIFIPVQAEVKP